MNHVRIDFLSNVPVLLLQKKKLKKYTELKLVDYYAQLRHLKVGVPHSSQKFPSSFWRPQGIERPRPFSVDSTRPWALRPVSWTIPGKMLCIISP